eukprot:3428155-Pyramimonas_sp.AAC.1
MGPALGRALLDRPLMLGVEGVLTTRIVRPEHTPGWIVLKGCATGDPRQVVGRTDRNLPLDHTEQTVKVLINDISGHRESEE